jgi:hypothetical protein
MKVFIVIALVCLPLMPSRLVANPGIEGNSHLRSAAREIKEEADPAYDLACFSMGMVTIDYASEERGLPKTGFRITDPLGREIGYDPRTNEVRQQIPLAQAYLDCEENDKTGELRQCKDHIEICGPVSGTYRIELLPMQKGKVSFSVSAASRRTHTESGNAVTTSQASWESEIGEQNPAVLLLQYCRESGTQITLTEETHPLASR